MKKLFVKLIFIFSFFLSLTLGVYWVYGQESNSSNNSGSSSYQAELQKKIEELEQKLDSVKNQKQSLSKEIASLENKINLTEYRIASANLKIQEKVKEISFLEGDITFLENRLANLESSIAKQEEVLDRRIRERYKISRVNKVGFFLSNSGFSKITNLLKYTKIAEERDNQLLTEMRSTKKAYEAQQGILEVKRQEVIEAKKQLELQKAEAERLKGELNDLKNKKRSLLEVTKNDEKRYQKLLEDAKRELNQILDAANVVIREGNAVKVKQGEILGTMGNSGFSTGTHLHFGIYKYSVDAFKATGDWGWYYKNYINPLKKLKNKTVYWGTGCYLDPSGYVDSGSGDWSWPVDKPYITQSFGSNTCYNWMYGYKPHPALDMVTQGSYSIRAIADGDAYFCRNCLGDGGNGVFVFHEGGYMSLYWHLK